jgi:hypothetical protein
MPFYVRKTQTKSRYTYAATGQRLSYSYNEYEGPFKTLTEAKEFLEAQYIDGAEILKLGD